MTKKNFSVDFIIHLFHLINYREESNGLLIYFIPFQKKLKWSSMFGLMEEVKNILDIEDYSIMQTTLEQLFMSFAKRQFEKSVTAKKSKMK